jgi:hypothetical protein
MSYKEDGRQVSIGPETFGPDGGVRVREVISTGGQVELEYRIKVRVKGHDLDAAGQQGSVSLKADDSWLLVDASEALECTWINVTLAEDVGETSPSGIEETHITLEVVGEDSLARGAEQGPLRLSPGEPVRLIRTGGAVQDGQPLTIAITAYLPGALTIYQEQELTPGTQDLAIHVSRVKR